MLRPGGRFPLPGGRGGVSRGPVSRSDRTLAAAEAARDGRPSEANPAAGSPAAETGHAEAAPPDDGQVDAPPASSHPHAGSADPLLGGYAGLLLRSPDRRGPEGAVRGARLSWQLHGSSLLLLADLFLASILHFLGLIPILGSVLAGLLLIQEADAGIERTRAAPRPAPGPAERGSRLVWQIHQVLSFLGHIRNRAARHKTRSSAPQGINAPPTSGRAPPAPERRRLRRR